MGEPSPEEDFHRRLWLRLEEKGTIGDLRAQLRLGIASALKSDALEKDLKRAEKYKRSVSPKFKAINLLIADYLVQQGYRYTLSLFTLEDPALIPIAHRSKLANSKDTKICSFKFIKRDVADILETLGFPTDNDVAKEVRDDYLKANSEDSLMLCLLKFFSKKLLKTLADIVESGQNISKRNHEAADSKAIEEEKAIQKAYEDLQMEFNKELEIAKDAEREKYEHLMAAHNKLLKSQVEELRKQYNENAVSLKKKFDQKLISEKKKFLKRERLREMEIEKGLQRDLNKEKERLLQEFKSGTENKNIPEATLVDVQQSSLEIALKAVQHQSSRLRRREERLNKRMADIMKTNTNKMIDVSCQFSHDTDSGNSEKSDEHSTPMLISTPSGLNPELKSSIAVQTDIVLISVPEITPKMSTYCQTTPIGDSFKSIDTQIKFAGSDDHPVFRDRENVIFMKESTSNVVVEPHISLQHENTYLKTYNEQQREHIKELISKQTSMCSEIKDANIKISSLTNQIDLLKSVIDTKLASVNDVNATMRKCKIVNRPRSSSVENYNSSVSGKEIEEIKKNLRMLESEGERFVKSYEEFKQRRTKPAETVSRMTPMKDLILKHSHVKPQPFVPRQSLKDNFIHSYDYLNRYYVNDYDSANNKRAFDPEMNINKDILQNYIDTSFEYSKYDQENPKKFADILIKRKITRNIEDIPQYTKFHFDKFDSEYDSTKNSSDKSGEGDILSSSISDLINAERKNSEFELRRNNLRRRWSLPSSFRKRAAPVSYKVRNHSPDMSSSRCPIESIKPSGFRAYLTRQIFKNDKSNKDKDTPDAIHRSKYTMKTNSLAANRVKNDLNAKIKMATKSALCENEKNEVKVADPVWRLNYNNVSEPIKKIFSGTAKDKESNEMNSQEIKDVVKTSKTHELIISSTEKLIDENNYGGVVQSEVVMSKNNLAVISDKESNIESNKSFDTAQNDSEKCKESVNIDTCALTAKFNHGFSSKYHISQNDAANKSESLVLHDDNDDDDDDDKENIANSTMVDSGDEALDEYFTNLNLSNINNNKKKIETSGGGNFNGKVENIIVKINSAVGKSVENHQDVENNNNDNNSFKITSEESSDDMNRLSGISVGNLSEENDSFWEF